VAGFNNKSRFSKARENLRVLKSLSQSGKYRESDFGTWIEGFSATQDYIKDELGALAHLADGLLTGLSRDLQKLVQHAQAWNWVSNELDLTSAQKCTELANQSAHEQGNTARKIHSLRNAVQQIRLARQVISSENLEKIERLETPTKQIEELIESLGEEERREIELAIRRARDAVRRAKKEVQYFSPAIELINNALKDLSSATNISSIPRGHTYHIGVNMGDIFSNITGSSIVNRSTVERSFNRVQQDYGDDTARALLRVAEEIHKSGNKEAAEMFSSFNWTSVHWAILARIICSEFS